MNHIVLAIKKILFLSAASCMALAQGAQAQSVAVFGLFQSKNSVTHIESIQQLEKITKPLSCALRREGKIIKAQGDYHLPDINSFFLLECESSFIQTNRSDEVLEYLTLSNENIVLLEGPVSQFGKFGLAKTGANNSYIFKLSDYNNTFPEQRNSDLTQLDKLLGGRKDRYKTEAFIRVNNAYGMKRPDEVVAIYYDSPESGERFRSNNDNSDIMNLIANFNKRHLTQASYLIAQSNR